MACMCGDTMCPSCGPAQGYNPDFEIVCEWLEHCVLVDFPGQDGIIDVMWLAEDIGDRLGKHCEQETLDMLLNEAHQWARENQRRIRN